MSGHSVVVCDFNVDLGATERPASTDLFIQSFSQHHYDPLITLPTRISAVHASTIDHIWFNGQIDCLSGVIRTDISDHYALSVSQ